MNDNPHRPCSSRHQTADGREVEKPSGLDERCAFTPASAYQARLCCYYSTPSQRCKRDESQQRVKGLPVMLFCHAKDRDADPAPLSSRGSHPAGRQGRPARHRTLGEEGHEAWCTVTGGGRLSLEGDRRTVCFAILPRAGIREQAQGGNPCGGSLESVSRSCYSSWRPGSFHMMLGIYGTEALAGLQGSHRGGTACTVPASAPSRTPVALLFHVVGSTSPSSVATLR